MATAKESFDSAGGVCEKCGCMLVPVSSLATLKWHECIRALNTPTRCSGTDRQWRNWPGDEVRRMRHNVKVSGLAPSQEETK